MSNHLERSSVNWRQAAGEALLIFLGVGVALLGQAWWEYGADRELEQHLLEGIRADLSRDSIDASLAILAANDRLVGADRLLEYIEDPDAGVHHPTSWSDGRPGQVAIGTVAAFEDALANYASAAIPPNQALHMVASTMQRLDLSDATFSEATASGQLNVITDADLRALIADYYFTTGRFGSTWDDRVQVQWHRFRGVLAESGLSAVGGESDQRVLEAFRSDQQLLAELKNLRSLALGQAGAHTQVLIRAEGVISRLAEVLRS